MVQSLGISVGNSNSYVAAGQGGGIEILLNEYSNRATPTMVAFTDQFRAMGVDASSNMFMNLKNTIYDIMVLLGKPYKDIKQTDENGRPIYSFKLEEAPDGQALVVVGHLGQERKFTMTQILAMMFTKLRDIAGGTMDCVLSCPQFFNEQRKAALVQAALVAGLNPLQVISDMSAVILNYAYYRTSKEEGHKFIAFINIGQANLQSVLAWLTPKEDTIRILAAESEDIGGKDFDRILAEQFISQHNLSLTPKSYLKLLASCEKLKRQLSANNNPIPISVESLISEDKDFNSQMDRSTFERLSENLLKRIEACFRRLLDNARVEFDRIMSETAEAAKAAEVARAAESTKTAELVKQADIAKANKAAVQAKLAEEAKEAAEAAKQAPKEDNGVEASETSKETPMEQEAEELTKASAEEARALQAMKSAKAAEKAMSSQANKLTKLAAVQFDLQTVEMVGGSARIPAIKQLIKDVFNLAPSTTLNTDEAVARGCVLHCATLHPGMKVKREVRILNSDSFTKPSSLACDKDFRRVEIELISADRKYRARTEARNNLEEYIYSERSKLPEGDKLLEELSAHLDWLFSDDGEEASEEEYNNRLKQLKSLSEARLTNNTNSNVEQSEGDSK